MRIRIITAIIIIVLFFNIPLSCNAFEEKAKQDASIREKLGDFYFQKGDRRDALLEWEKAIRLDPQRTSCYLKLGDLYYSTGLPEKSLFYLEKAVALSPSDPFCRFNRGLALFTCERLSEALTEFTMTIRLFPEREYTLYPPLDNNLPDLLVPYNISPPAWAHFFTACIYQKQGDFTRAIFELTHSFLPAASLLSIEDPAMRVHAFLNLMSGENCYTGSALDVTVLDNCFISVSDEKGRTLYSKSLSFSISGNGKLVSSEGYTTGITVPNEMTDLFINCDGVVYGVPLGRELQKKIAAKPLGKLDLATFSRPWELLPRSPGIFEDSPASGRRTVSRAFLAPFQRKIPLFLHNQTSLWEIITKSGMMVLSEQSMYRAFKNFSEKDEILFYEQAVKSNDGPISRIKALFCLAPLYFRNGEPKKAEEVLGEALKIKPDNGFLHYNMGYLYQSLHEWKRSQNEYKKALQNLPASSTWNNYNLLKGRTLLCLGLNHQKFGESDQAIQCFKDSLGNDPETGYEAYLPLTELLKEKKQNECALIYLFEFLQASLVPGESNLDIGILGDVFFEVRDAQGEKAYSRLGHFTLNSHGEIITKERYSTNIFIPYGVSNLTFSTGGELLGTDRNGIKKSFGKLRIVSLSKPIRRSKGYYVDESGEGSPGEFLLASGFVNKQSSFVEEYRAWQILRSLTGDDRNLRSIIDVALLGKWKEVAEQIKKLKNSGEGRDFIHYLSARAHIAMGNLREAQSELESIKSEENEIAWCLRETILTYLEGDNPPEKTLIEVTQLIENLLLSSHENSDLLFLLAWIDEIRGQHQKASERYGKFLKNESRSMGVPLRLRILLKRIVGKPDFKLIESLMPGHPGHIESGFALCTSIVSPDESKTSDKMHSKISLQSPTLSKARKKVDITELETQEKILYAHYRVGKILENQGDLQNAILHYRQYVQLKGYLNPHLSSFISQDIIRAYFKADLLDEVRNELDLMKYEYRCYNRSLANLFTMLGKAYEVKGKNGKARECYKEAEAIRKNLSGR